MKLRKLMKKIPFDAVVKVVDTNDEASFLFKGIAASMSLATYLYSDYKVKAIKGGRTDDKATVVIFVEEVQK